MVTRATVKVYIEIMTFLAQRSYADFEKKKRKCSPKNNPSNCYAILCLTSNCVTHMGFSRYLVTGISSAEEPHQSDKPWQNIATPCLMPWSLNWSTLTAPSKRRPTTRYPAALEMTLHYFQVDQLEPAQDKRLRKVFQKEEAPLERGPICDRFTPATVEQMASEHETVDGFISALEAQVLLR